VDPKIETRVKVGFAANGECVSRKIKRKRRKFTDDFKAKAVARMEKCDSVVGLARELGITWSLLYKWKAHFDRAAMASRERELEEELKTVKLALAEKTLEADFFKSALQRVEARRQAGRVTSTTRSGN
jgi:transposase-like protein